MSTENTYSRVVFRGPDDRDNKEMVNSLAHRSVSPNKIRKWSPDISAEERNKKKRLREDEYVKTFDESERPILLIKKKHQYKDAQPPAEVDDVLENEDFYRIAKNTRLIDDVHEELNKQKPMISRQTYVHNNPKSPRDVNESLDASMMNTLYKIEGIEFLPEGFLELDPILFKDEYEFDVKLYEKMFEEEQKRVKELRRKQYAEKNYQKMRDVTIFVADENKNKIIEFLEFWYFKNKRKMNPKELNTVSQRLQTTPEILQRFETVFLQKKKEINREDLKRHLSKKELVTKRQKIDSLPKAIRRYFDHVPSDNYSHIGSKVYSDHRSFDPFNSSKSKSQTKRSGSQTAASKLIRSAIEEPSEAPKNSMPKMYHNDVFRKHYDSELEKEEARRSEQQKLSNSKKEGKPRSNSKNREVNDAAKEYFKDNDDIFNGDWLERSKSGAKQSRGASKPKSHQGGKDGKGQGNSHWRNDDDDIKKYIDYDVSHILERLKKTPTKDAEEPRQSSKEEARASQQKRKQTEKEGGEETMMASVIPQVDIEGLLKEYEQDPTGVRSWALTNFSPEFMEGIDLDLGDLTEDTSKNNNPWKKSTAQKNSKSSVTPSKKSSAAPEPKISVSEIKTKKSIPEPVRSSKTDQTDKKLRESAAKPAEPAEETENQAKQSQEVDEIDPKKLLGFLEEPKRVTIAGTNERGQSVLVHKMRPTLIGDQYYYQTINDLFEEGGSRHVSVIISNGNGEIIAEQEIDPKLIGNFYEADLVNQDGNPITENETEILEPVTLVLKNERDEVVSEFPVRPEISRSTELNMNAIQNVFDPKGRKTFQGTLEMKNSVAIRNDLRPLLVGNQYYRQSVTLSRGEDGSTLAVVETRDEKGKLEDIREVDPNDIGEQFVTEVVEEKVTPDGRRTFLLATNNEHGKTIALVEVSPQIIELASMNLKQIIEEVVDQEGNEKLTAVLPGENNEAIVVKQVVRLSSVSPHDPKDFEDNKNQEEKPEDAEEPQAITLFVMAEQPNPEDSDEFEDESEKLDRFASNEAYADKTPHQVEDIFEKAMAGKKEMKRLSAIQPLIQAESSSRFKSKSVSAPAPHQKKTSFSLQPDAEKENPQPVGRSSVISKIGDLRAALATEDDSEHLEVREVEEDKEVEEDEEVTEVKEVEEYSEEPRSSKPSRLSEPPRASEKKSKISTPADKKSLVKRDTKESIPAKRDTKESIAVKKESIPAKRDTKESIAFKKESIPAKRDTKESIAVKKESIPAKRETKELIPPKRDTKTSYASKIESIQPSEARTSTSKDRESEAKAEPIVNTSNSFVQIAEQEQEEKEPRFSSEQKARSSSPVETRPSKSTEKNDRSSKSQNKNEPQIDEDRLRSLAAEVFKQELGKMDFSGNELGGKASLLEEFHAFCADRLPNDNRYKESVLFVSMFYYFMDKKAKKNKSN